MGSCDPNWCLQFPCRLRVPPQRRVLHGRLADSRSNATSTPRSACISTTGPNASTTTAPRPDGAAATAAIRASGDCAFFEPDRGRLCAIHRELGAERLPEACRQFPRVVLHDPRGTLISLSHFCPTAAALLAAPGPFGVVAAGSYLGLDGGAEGLDARGVCRPCCAPGC